MSNPKLKKLKKLTPKNEQDEAVRVLYVEDTEVIRDTITRLLEVNGYHVSVAKNGQEGVEVARTWQPDIILMDLRMPVMDGYNAIEALKFDPATEHIPIIVISAWSSKNERTQAKLAGADEFFVKPPDLNRLMKTIQTLINA
ncbi:MAG: response regulator [Anaerolineae bacterium]|nr:response regulator [Anaerolineae bacterium]